MSRVNWVIHEDLVGPTLLKSDTLKEVLLLEDKYAYFKIPSRIERPPMIVQLLMKRGKVECFISLTEERPNFCIYDKH